MTKIPIERKFTPEESASISIIRWIAMVSIIIGHILQSLGFQLYQAFHVGVPIFFFISGFLYGKKNPEPLFYFYWHRLLKIYLPYLIYCIIYIILIYVTGIYKFTISSVLEQLFLPGSILPGLEHFWFIRVIIICYIFLPFVIKFSSSNNIFLFFTISSLLLLSVFFKFQSYGAWIGTYYIGFYSGKFKKIHPYVWILSFISTFVLCVIYLPSPKVNLIYDTLLHCTAGYLIFLSLYDIFKRFKYIFYTKNITDILGGNLTYEMYFTHPLFIWGSISLLLPLSSHYFIFSIIGIFLSTFGFAYLVHKLYLFVLNKINQSSVINKLLSFRIFNYSLTKNFIND